MYGLICASFRRRRLRRGGERALGSAGGGEPLDAWRDGSADWVSVRCVGCDADGDGVGPSNRSCVGPGERAGNGSRAGGVAGGGRGAGVASACGRCDARDACDVSIGTCDTSSGSCDVSSACSTSRRAAPSIPSLSPSSLLPRFRARVPQRCRRFRLTCTSSPLTTPTASSSSDVATTRGAPAARRALSIASSQET